MIQRGDTRQSRANDRRGFGSLPEPDTMTRGELALANRYREACRAYTGHSKFMLDMRRRSQSIGWLPSRNQAKVITKILRDEGLPVPT